jgi:putative lipoic acid-binding regulatory protein
MNDMRQEIEFPVEWSYRIITDTSVESCRDDLMKVLRQKGVNSDLEMKDKSASGKYQAYRVSVIFDSKEMMDELSAELSAVNGVKFLL